MIYKLLPQEIIIGDAVSIIKLPVPYDTLHYGLDPTTMIAAPYSSLRLDTFKVHLDDIQFINSGLSAHKIRGIRVETNRIFVVTYGFDGIVGVLKNSDTMQLTSVASHHRLHLGVSKAILRPSGDILISLGSDGSLVGMKLSGREEKDEVERISLDYSQLSQEVANVLSQSYEEVPPKDSETETWGDWMVKQEMMQEEEKFRTIKSSIFEDFHRLKEQVSKLLDDNEKLSDEEQLPISAFDLDMLEREQKIKAAREEREDQRLQLEFQCSQIEKVANWIRKVFWDDQQVKPQSIFTIFGDIEVLNFPNVAQEVQEEEMKRLFEYFSNISDESHFEKEPRAYKLLKAQYSPIAQDERTMMDRLFEEDDEVAKAEKNEELRATAGK